MFKVDAAKLLELDEARERQWRDAELRAADLQVNKLVDVGASAQPWRNYREALRKWPEHQKFPDPVHRPKTPA